MLESIQKSTGGAPAEEAAPVNTAAEDAAAAEAAAAPAEGTGEVSVPPGVGVPGPGSQNQALIDTILKNVGGGAEPSVAEQAGLEGGGADIQMPDMGLATPPPEPETTPETMELGRQFETPAGAPPEQMTLGRSPSEIGGYGPSPEKPPAPPGASQNWDALWDVFKEYAPYVAGGAALGGLGSALAQRMQGVRDPRMRKIFITAALTGGVGALLKATGGVEGLQGRFGGGNVVA